MPTVVHLTDSPFFGGPERQMLGLSVSLPASVRTTILCFRDHASGAPFLEQLARAGVTARMIGHANPRFLGMIADVARELRATRADLLVCHGYKADVLGWIAARRVGIPVLSVSRGWTGHTRKVRAYEALDRQMLRRMDGVVCVSEGQAIKVRRAGVPAERVHVIHNAIDPSRFAAGGGAARASGRAALQALFASPRDHVVVGVGRLSPEKGFADLVEAARLVVQELPDAGFVIVGDGPSRQGLEAQLRDAGLAGHVVLAGFRADVDALLPGADVLAQSSHTEGLPNVVLEACAAGVPVVATDVGGTGEVVADGVNGRLVPAGAPRTLASRLLELLRDPVRRQAMGEEGCRIVRRDFAFATQGAAYEALFADIIGQRPEKAAPALALAAP
jgi:glycosyltransferase involved in cell wall biosynthesis